MIKAVIFDMDGVLIDSEEFYFERRMKFMAERGRRPSSSSFKDYIGASNDRIWQLLVKDDEGLRAELEQDYLEYQKQNPISYQKCLKPKAEVTIKALHERDIKLAVASASPKHEVDRMLQECNLDSYFQHVLSGEDIENNKPAPDIYLEAVARVDEPKENCLAIEDSEIGIEAAKAAGLTTWALQQSYTVNQRQADLCLVELDMLLYLF